MNRMVLLIAFISAIGIIILLNILAPRKIVDEPISWGKERCDKYFGKNYCRLPFAIILSKPDEFVGRNIAIQGFLVKEGASYVLYDTFDSAKRYMQQNALLVLPSSDGAINASLALLTNSSIRVSGRIKLLGSRFTSYWAEIELLKPPSVGYWLSEVRQRDSGEAYNGTQDDKAR
ncbi:MAG: hypothetical protein AB7F83_09010 [Lysobacterales bacterium]